MPRSSATGPRRATAAAGSTTRPSTGAATAAKPRLRLDTPHEKEAWRWQTQSSFPRRSRAGRPQGLEEPVGRGRRDRAPQLDHARDERGDPRPPRRAPRLRPERRVLHRDAVLGGRGRPRLRHLDDPHAAGVGQRQPLRRRLAVHEAYSYCGDSIHMYTHCGTHIDTLNHLGFHGRFWNGWAADRDLGSRIWNKGGLEKYPPVIARGVLLDVAGTHGVDVPRRTATRSRRRTCRTPSPSRASSSGRATSCSSGPDG